MSNRLKGKVAIVSGIANGIAKATALRFAREGAVVVGSDINVEGARATGAEAAADGFMIDVVAPVDMFDQQAVEAFIDDAARRHGRLDALINAAAVVDMAWIEDMTAEQFRRTIVGEVDVVFYACRAAWPHLKVNGGSIVNFASVAARMAVDTLPAIAHSAGKGAVMAMTRQLAMEGAPHNIRANSISPGMVVTASTQPALDQVPGFRAAIDNKLMLKRLGRPDDIAAGCLYLISDDASWVTGADLPIDGGMTAW